MCLFKVQGYFYVSLKNTGVFLSVVSCVSKELFFPREKALYVPLQICLFSCVQLSGFCDLTVSVTTKKSVVYPKSSLFPGKCSLCTAKEL